jgi:uncharacterized metal-binding protein
MPSGITHRTINTIVSVPATGAVLYWQHSIPNALLFAAGYTFATFLMNPDLDLDSDGYNSWGMLRFYWWPYKEALAHRSVLSHFPVLSTILRIIYLMWLPVLLLLVLGSAVRAAAREAVLDWVPEYLPYILFTIFGMMCSDTLHAILDVSSTKMKRFYNRHFRHSRRHIPSFLEHHGQGHHHSPREEDWRRRGYRSSSRRTRR